MPVRGVWGNLFGLTKVVNCWNYLVRLAGFEPATYGLEVRCSIQLSYRRNKIITSFDTICSIYVHKK